MKKEKLDPKKLILIAMAPAHGGSHTPVQMQKLIFLLDRKLASELGGPHFNFKPYDYGPFDRSVYDALTELQQEGLVDPIATTSLRWNKFRTTQQGQDAGEQLLNSMKPSVSAAIIRLSEFVRRLSFADLVSAIYKAYPEMKVNSVFRG
jgi:uncharacterized protein YwgA